MLNSSKVKQAFFILIASGVVIALYFSGFSYKANKHKVTYIQDTLSSNKLAPKMVLIPPGEGVIGGEKFRSFQNEGPIFNISISNAYLLSENEITFEQYDQFCQATLRSCPEDEGWGRGSKPVINVSWIDAVAYTKWLSKETGNHYRLPSETEWEYAARAGQAHKFWWGDKYIQGIDHCDRDLGGCPSGADLGRTWQVGLLSQNPFGLYDVTSNVMEWVQDCYAESHKDNVGTVEPNIQGNCDEKVVKGASWLTAQPHVHHSARFGLQQKYTSYAVGFRVLRELNIEGSKK